jgi:alcohol dehydrogenase (NADP+)
MGRRGSNRLSRRVWTDSGSTIRTDIGLNEPLPIYESARIKPAVVQVEAHPYLPETERLEFCKEKDVVFLAFAPLGHGLRPGRSKIQSFRQLPHEWARRRHRCCWLGRYSVARLCLPHPGRRPPRGRISTSPLFRKTRWMKTGSPGFIPQGRRSWKKSKYVKL